MNVLCSECSGAGLVAKVLVLVRLSFRSEAVEIEVALYECCFDPER